MSWENEIKEYYADKRNKSRRLSRSEVDNIFENAVLPAFNEIENNLGDYVSNLKISHKVYIAKLSFDEYRKHQSRHSLSRENINKSVFIVEVSDRYRRISFPFLLNGTRHSAKRIDIDELVSLDKEFVINKFMEFFRSRGNTMKERAKKQEEELREYYKSHGFDDVDDQ